MNTPQAGDTVVLPRHMWTNVECPETAPIHYVDTPNRLVRVRAGGQMETVTFAALAAASDEGYGACWCGLIRNRHTGKPVPHREWDHPTTTTKQAR